MNVLKQVRSVYQPSRHPLSMKRFNVVGSWPALVTPFTDGDQVNVESRRRLVQFHVENRSDGVLLMGSTGEAILLTAEERNRVIDAAIDEASGRVPIMVGVAAISTRQTIENARYAEDAGADCGLVVQPDRKSTRLNSSHGYI